MKQSRLPRAKLPEPPTIRAMLWEATRWPIVRYLAPVLVLVIAIAAVRYVEVVQLWPPQLRLRSAVPPAASRAVPPATLATFPSVWPHANNGLEWEVFNDNKFLGRSSAWYETLPTPEAAGDFFLRIHYSLDRGQRSLIPDAYSGIYLPLDPPLGSVDLSRFTAIAFRVRALPAADSPPVRLLINLANPSVENYAFHEYELTPLLRDGRFVDVTVPFAALRVPDWAAKEDPTPPPFDPSDVFRLSFVVKGAAGAGAVDLDQIAFVEKSSPSAAH